MYETSKYLMYFAEKKEFKIEEKIWRKKDLIDL